MSRLPAGRGARWIADGGNLLGSAPGPLAGVAALWLLVSLIQFVPLIGALVLILIMPLLTAGLLTAFHFVARGDRPAPLTLFEGWQNPRTRGRLLVLGVFVLLGFLVIMLIFTAWLGAGTSADDLARLGDSPEAMFAFLAERNLWSLIIPAGGVGALILAGLYFGVPLVMFTGVRPLAAIVTSLRACLRNWAALLVFGLMVIGLSLAAGLVAMLIAMPLLLAFGEGAGGMLAQIPVLVIALILQMVLAGAQYRAFVEIFGAPGGGERTADDALVA